MKGKLIRAILILCLLCFELLPISHSWAVSIESIPNPRRNNGTWVSDVANILSAETELQLSTLANDAIPKLVKKAIGNISTVFPMF
ncbi:MAG: hypothetical protein AUK48_06565 [Oscillatoriales cyanobacterium CG2_30_44_21]|nr:MAG: hypothetical protein AUK48_06565 [Oscillatoriales cyanobacterium CG2_30_44_21]